MKVYAVRQKSTGLFIPRLETGKRGGSWLEPSNEREPRIFHNKQAAGLLGVVFEAKGSSFKKTDRV